MSTPPDRAKSPYELGQQAAEEGKSWRDNPTGWDFDRVDEAHEWERGFSARCAELRGKGAKMRITEQQLVEKSACSDQVAVFTREWPDGVEITLPILERAVALKLDLYWFASRFLTAPALAEYDRVTATARAERDRVSATALWAGLQFDARRAELRAARGDRDGK